MEEKINERDINKIENWIKNITNPNTLSKELFSKMLDSIKLELNDLLFNSYLKYILSKEENISLKYFSMEKDLYKFILFEDILNEDYKDYFDVKLNLDVEYIGIWWTNNILPIFKSKYDETKLKDKLILELKECNTLDFRGENFKKLKLVLENIINKEIGNYKENTLRDVLEELVKDEAQNVDKSEYLNIQINEQKKLQSIEENLLNDICKADDLKLLSSLQDEILSNGDIVKCEEIELIIFRKLDAIVKQFNLADINDEDNILIGQKICNNLECVDVNSSNSVKVLIDRCINIDLNNFKCTIKDLDEKIKEYEDIIIKNCMFNSSYYDFNIKIEDDFYIIKFKYLNKLIEYIKYKKGKKLLVNIKNINKNFRYKNRVFIKTNSKLIEKIDSFYSK